MPLRTQGYTIDRLSGPIEAHLLQPKREFKRQLPILFLFGDRHNSMTQLCTDCHCEGPGDESCCLEIFSDTFLNLLDQLAKDRKVSFYTEFFEPKQEKQLWIKRPDQFAKSLDRRLSAPLKGVMNQLRERLVACYLDTSMRSQHKDSKDLPNFCPTHLMDWEYADLRQLNTNVTIDTLVHTETYFYEAVLFRILYFVFLYTEGKDNENEVLDEDFDPIKLGKHLGQKAKDLYRSVSLLLRNPQSFADWFVSTQNRMGSHSLLLKMIKEHRVITSDQLADWIQIELNHYTHNASWFQDPNVQKWSIYFEQLAQGTFVSPPGKHVQAKEPIVFIDTCLPFLDLYFLLHAFHKKGLCIGYFGSTHIQGIIHLIVRRLGLYTEINNTQQGVKGKKGSERCLILDEVEWDLDAVLEESITGTSIPIDIPKVRDGFIPAGRILRTNKVLQTVKSPRIKKTKTIKK